MTILPYTYMVHYAEYATFLFVFYYVIYNFHVIYYNISYYLL